MFGETGNRKFGVIANDYLKCKHTLRIDLDSVKINISSLIRDKLYIIFKVPRY